MRADVSDEAEKGWTGEAEEDVPKRTVTEDSSTKPNGIAKSHGPLAASSVQLELPMSSRDKDDEPLIGRARAIIDSLDKLTSEEVFAAFEELDQLPSDVVRAALEGATGPAPDPELLDDAIRRAHGFPARALRLRKVAVTKDADIFDLGPVAEQQLRLAGKAWDGRDLEPEQRLDGEIEDSFAGTLELHVLADARSPDAPPLFDVLLYAGDAGTIFRAGTTEIVGAIAYGIVEMKDRRSRVAIQQALAQPVEPASPAAAPERAELSPPPSEELPLSSEPEPEPLAPPKKAAAAKKGARAPKRAAATEKAATEKAATEKAVAAKKAPLSSKKAAASSKKSAATSKKSAATSKKAPPAKAPPASKKGAASKKTSAKRPAAGASSAKAGAKKVGAKKATTKKAAAKRSAKKPADG